MVTVFMLIMQFLSLQDDYGIDWEGPSGVDHDSVIVPEIDCPLTASELEALTRVVDPMEECDDYGIGL